MPDAFQTYESADRTYTNWSQPVTEAMDNDALVQAVRIRLGEKGLCQRCRRRMIDKLNARRTGVGYICRNRGACRLALFRTAVERLIIGRSAGAASRNPL